jgi:hypothetical protein
MLRAWLRITTAGYTAFGLMQCAMSHIKKYPVELGKVRSKDLEVNISPKSERRREKSHDDKAEDFRRRVRDCSATPERYG